MLDATVQAPDLVSEGSMSQRATGYSIPTAILLF